MNLFRVLKMGALLAVGLAIAGLRAEAQQYFGLGAVASSDAVLVSNSLTYTITVTNLSPYLLGDVTVSNTLSGPFQYVSATLPAGSFTNYGNVAVFNLGAYAYGAVEQMTLVVQPTATELLTNTIAVTSIELTNAVTTNLVTLVTNDFVTADLAVTLAVPTVPVITNDLMAYSVSVTNAGPGNVTGVILTNTLPPGVIFKGVSPASQAYTVSSSNLIFNLGTLTNGAYQNFQLSVEPTNIGVLPFTAALGAPDVTDPNLTNNVASAIVDVIGYPPSQLVASVTSTQLYNPQNGLVEQTIAVSNAGPSSVTAVRVVLTGLTNLLFNAVGTNSGNPFVVYPKALDSGQTISLLLQFFADNYFTFTNAQLQAFAVPLPDLVPPPTVLTSTNLNISRIVELANGEMLIEFPSTAGRSYTVVYSDNVLFSNAMIAPPPIMAPANRTQWIDYGPPATISSPANTPARFYRVIQNP